MNNKYIECEKCGDEFCEKCIIDGMCPSCNEEEEENYFDSNEF